MSAQGSGRSFLYDALFENLSLKVLSILCAIGFFVFIRGSERAELRFEVGVAHSDPPDSVRRILVKEPPTELSVTLRGPRAQLETLQRDLGTLTLDFSTGYESVIEIKPAMIPNLPPGVEVVQVFPSRIDVRWDDVVSREIPVQLSVVGQPAEGHMISGAVSSVPQNVVATGPRTVVDLLQTARAAAFDISGASAGNEEQVLALDLPPQGVEYDAQSIRAFAHIVLEEKTVPFKAVRVEVVGAPNATTRPETVTVKVKGANAAVSGIEADQIVPRVELPADIDLKKHGSKMAKVLLSIEDVEVDIEPQEVLVKW
ncbi:MAG: YbbR-like domain-containing protein [Myxococcales bacterium]|nr:YbbR-like domain-containing protein [Myxococcales bacterium]